LRRKNVMVDVDDDDNVPMARRADSCVVSSQSRHCTHDKSVHTAEPSNRGGKDVDDCDTCELKLLSPHRYKDEAKYRKLGMLSRPAKIMSSVTARRVEKYKPTPMPKSPNWWCGVVSGPYSFVASLFSPGSARSILFVVV
jgi:hypothetical protein